MTKMNWIIILKAMQPHHQKLELINDLLEGFMSGKIDNLTERQELALNKVYASSWYKKQIDAKMNQLKYDDKFRTEIEEKLKNNERYSDKKLPSKQDIFNNLFE